MTAWVVLATVALNWLTARYADKKRPLTLFENIIALLTGLVAGMGFVYAYMHPSLEKWWSLIDLEALRRFCIAALTVLVSIYICLAWISWLFEKWSGNAQKEK